MDNNASAIFEGLNSEQAAAVSCTDGPVLIVAGAGSGKTRVLTCRVANILEKGCGAERILALTFTKKAAEEMKERIGLMVGPVKARRLVMGTFHSVFVRFLRDWAEALGYPKQFTIYDQGDQLSAVKTCIKELGLDDKIYKPKEVLSRISMAKNNLVTPPAYRANPTAVANDARAKKPRICDIYQRYWEKCRQSGVMDFDDLLLNLNILFKDHPEALEEISSRFSYILVDEYQDTNFAQYLAMRKLASPHGNICVVGDDSQSIYAFRGAKIENILNFKKDYPSCRTFRLERNYRSTQNIVCAANSLIEHNTGRIPKECYSEAEKGEKLRLVRAYTEQEEAMQIVADILSKIHTYKAPYSDFAVLYRTNSQSRAIEEALRRKNLPYRIFSGNSFFDRAEVKDLMAYFKLAVNPSDDESFKRAVNKPARGIGGTSMDALETAGRAMGLPLMQVAMAEGLQQFGLKDAAIGRIRSFCQMMTSFATAQATEQADTLATRIANESGLYAFYKSDNSIEGLARLANVDELLNSTAQFVEDCIDQGDDEVPAGHVGLSDYLEDVSLLSAVDTGDDEDTNKVTLMTVHSSKGLEFPYVTIAGMEENLFPGCGSMGSLSDVEEERRLFYVAITRAMKTVVLTYADTRMRNGRHEQNRPSRFLRELDPQYVANPLTRDEDSDFYRFVQMGYEKKAFQGTTYTHGHKATNERLARSGAGSGTNAGLQKASRWAPPSRNAEGGMSSIGKASGEGRPAYHGKAEVLGRQLPEKIAPDSDFIPLPVSAFRVGQRIEHNRFGPGLIKEITGDFPALKGIIEFDSYGVKTIMLGHAKIRLEK